MGIVELLESVGLSGLLDIAFMSVVIYSILVWFKRTRAAFVVIGMSVIGTAYLFARQMDLMLTISVFQGFFAVIIIAVVIIFQEEIKHFLEQIASYNILTRFRGRTRPVEPARETQALLYATTALSEDKTGALIVVAGKDPLARHLEGGTELHGEISEPLLRSVFDTSSPSHDGAVIIAGGVLSKFSCYLPLSKNLEALRKMGSRHAAALGLAELTDALCIVVSEQKGTISIARNGNIRQIKNAEELKSVLDQFYHEIVPPPQSKRWRDFFRRNYKEKAIAVVATSFLWFFFVHESKIEYRTYVVPITLENVPTQFVATKTNPKEIEVTFSGPRRSFYFVDGERIKVQLKLFDAKKGVLRKAITPSNIDFPEGLTVQNIQPNSVAIEFEGTTNPE